MIKNERLHIAVKAGSPPETCFYSNIDPLDPHCCNSRSLGATCFYSNMEPTRNVNKLRTERARWLDNAVKTGLRQNYACKCLHCENDPFETQRELNNHMIKNHTIKCTICDTLVYTKGI